MFIYIKFRNPIFQFQKGTPYPFERETDEALIFEVLIREIVSAIHRIYLDVGVLIGINCINFISFVF